MAGDQIPMNALIRKVYDSPMVMRFLARASGKSDMYQMDDEFQNLNIMYMYDGCSRAWHYDGTDTVITLLLQKPEEGGQYEFAPFIRGEARGQENFEEVARLRSLVQSYKGLSVPTVVVGNKTDLPREISREMVETQVCKLSDHVTFRALN